MSTLKKCVTCYIDAEGNVYPHLFILIPETICRAEGYRTTLLNVNGFYVEEFMHAFQRQFPAMAGEFYTAKREPGI
jgi:hypothetical protein